jgi:hypothetical protein
MEAVICKMEKTEFPPVDIPPVGIKGSFYVCENGLGSTYVNQDQFFEPEAIQIAKCLGRVFPNQEGYRKVQTLDHTFYVYQDRDARIHLPFDKTGLGSAFITNKKNLMTLSQENRRCRRDPDFAQMIANERHYSE